jgi:hypothetical protein
MRRTVSTRRGLSNGETASLKTLLAHDDSENDLTTPSKDGTLVIRQVGLQKTLWLLSCPLPPTSTPGFSCHLV